MLKHSTRRAGTAVLMMAVAMVGLAPRAEPRGATLRPQRPAAQPVPRPSPQPETDSRTQANGQTTKLTGTVIGTNGSWENNGNDRSKVFDGDPRTAFNGPKSDGVWAGLDLGNNKAAQVVKIRFYPRDISPARMIGGKFQGSDSQNFSRNVVDLFVVQNQPKINWNVTTNIASTQKFRYLRYLSPNDGYGDVAEVEFYSADVQIAEGGSDAKPKKGNKNKGKPEPTPAPQPPSTGLQIQVARYEKLDGSQGRDVSRLLTRLIQNGGLDVVVSNEAMGFDPAPSETKRLHIEFTKGGKKISRNVTEGDRLHIKPLETEPKPDPQPNPRPTPTPRPQPAPPVSNVQFYGGKSTLGRGFNMFAATSSEETVAQLLQFSANQSTVQVYGHALPVPGNVDVVPQAQTEFQSEHTSAYNASEVQNTLQVAAGIEGGYKGFKASVEAKYGQSSSQQLSTTFVEYNVNVRPAVANFKAGSTTNLTPAFSTALAQFRDPNSVNNVALQDQFFKDYGTHYVRQVTLGATCSMVAHLKHSANMDKTDVQVAAKASWDGKLASVSGSLDVRTTEMKKRFEENSRVAFIAAGGDANIIINGGGLRGQINQNAYSAWVNSTKEAGKLSDVGRRMDPIWNLVSDATIKSNLSRAFEAYARRNHRPLDASQFTKTVMGYTVEVRLDRVYVRDDQDNVNAGDMFWHFTVDYPDFYDQNRRNKETLSERGRGNSYGMDSGNTYNFRDVAPDVGNLTKKFDVKPGSQVWLWGRMTDEDDGVAEFIGGTGADDPVGEFNSPFTLPMTQTWPSQINETRALGGNATVYYEVRISPRY